MQLKSKEKLGLAILFNDSAIPLTLGIISNYLINYFVSIYFPKCWISVLKFDDKKDGLTKDFLIDG